MSTIADIFLSDNEQLQAIANDEHVREGLSWHKENRVTDIFVDETRLMGHVEAPDSDDPYSSEMYYDSDGVMKVTCHLEKLQSAEVLMEKGIYNMTLNILGNALLQAAAAAARAEQAHAPAEHVAAVWLYGEAIPNGWLDQEQAGLISQLSAGAGVGSARGYAGGVVCGARKFVGG